VDRAAAAVTFSLKIVLAVLIFSLVFFSSPRTALQRPGGGKAGIWLRTDIALD